MKKRVFDILLSSTALVVLSPVLVGIALGTAISVGSPIIYKQPRVGQHKQPFTIYKFKSMTDAVDETGHLLPDSERVTEFGKFARKYGLDELPQLFNILAGDMSFVGPRPRVGKGAMQHNVPDSHVEIFSVRPGLTGPEQATRISLGHDLTLDQRLSLDFKYATAPPSILRDVWFVAKTFPVFFRGNGTKISTAKPDFF